METIVLMIVSAMAGACMGCLAAALCAAADEERRKK